VDREQDAGAERSSCMGQSDGKTLTSNTE